MNANQANPHLRSELQTFLKIKPPLSPLTTPYLSISDDKTTVTLSLPSQKPKSSKEVTSFVSSPVLTEYELDKVFSEFDEYSYIYENIANECVSDAINRTNYGFISYGEASSEKHSLIFGGHDCHKNLNTRGLFPRLLEHLLVKNGIVVYTSVCAVVANKLIDVAWHAKEMKEQIRALSDNNNHNKHKELVIEVFDALLSTSCEVNRKKDAMAKMQRTKIENMEQTKTYLHNCNALFSFIEQHHHNATATGNDAASALCSSAHYVYVIYIDDNKGQNISYITICELASNDNSVIANNAKQHLSQDNNVSTLESLTKAIRYIKKSYLTESTPVKEVSSKVSEQTLFDTSLTCALKDLMFYKKATKFRVVGCICLSSQGAKLGLTQNTLDFLVECRKITNPKRIDLNKELVNIEDKTNKDEIIYALEERCRVYMNKCKELSEIIEQKNAKNRNLHETYAKQLECLKECFNFKGDIAALMSADEYSKEMKYLKKVREAFDFVKVKTMQNSELEKKVVELEKEIERLKNRDDIRKRDQIMINYFTELKAKRSDENEKLRIHLAHANELRNLQAQNEKLRKLNEEYKKESEHKTKVIRGFNKMIQRNKPHSNNNSSSNINAIRKEIEHETETKHRNELTQYKHFIDNEKQTHEHIKETCIQTKHRELSELKARYEQMVHAHKQEEQSLLTENILLYELIMNIILKYKREFHTRPPDFVVPHNLNAFATSRDNFSRIIDTTAKNLNMVHFPQTMKNVDSKNAKMLKSGDFSQFRSEPLERIESSAVFKYNNNVYAYITKLENKNNCLDRENALLKNCENVTTQMQGMTVTEEKCDNEKEMKVKEICELPKDEIKKQMQRLKDEKEKMRLKLEEMIEINKKNKVVLNAQSRQIERLNQENISIKNNNNVLPQCKSFSTNTSQYMNYYYSHNNKSAYSAMSIGNKGVMPNVFCDSGFSTGAYTRPQTGLLKKSASARALK